MATLSSLITHLSLIALSMVMQPVEILQNCDISGFPNVFQEFDSNYGDASHAQFRQHLECKYHHLD